MRQRLEIIPGYAERMIQTVKKESDAIMDYLQAKSEDSIMLMHLNTDRHRKFMHDMGNILDREDAGEANGHMDTDAEYV